MNNSLFIVGGQIGGVFSVDLQDDRQGIKVFEVSGVGAIASFKHEAGCHRVQQIPPTERGGRVHSSTITVAVLDVPEIVNTHLDEKDLEWGVTRSTGSGGQSVNTTNSAVHLKHIPTGLMVRAESEKSQLSNKASAMAILTAKIQDQAQSAQDTARNNERLAQIGNGTRNERRRTVAYQRDQVVDHITGRKMQIEEYEKGNLDKLYAE